MAMQNFNDQYNPALLYLHLSGSHTSSPVQVCKLLRPVLFVVQVMSDISKEDCIYNKRILHDQCNKMRVCIHHQ